MQSHESIRPLAKALRRNKSLLTMDLYGCYMGDRGATDIAKVGESQKHSNYCSHREMAGGKTIGCLQRTCMRAAWELR